MDNIVSFENACERLKIHRQTLEYHLRKERRLPEGNIFKPAMRSGRKRYFMEKDVEQFKNAYLNTEQYTVEEISNMYGVPVQTIHYCLNTKRNIEPDAKRGLAHTFSKEKVKMLADVEGWTLVENVPGSRQLHDSAERQ